MVAEIWVWFGMGPAQPKEYGYSCLAAAAAAAAAASSTAYLRYSRSLDIGEFAIHALCHCNDILVRIDSSHICSYEFQVHRPPCVIQLLLADRIAVAVPRYFFIFLIFSASIMPSNLYFRKIKRNENKHTLHQFFFLNYPIQQVQS